MTIQPGALVRLDVERPAVGGRMIARAGGRVVLVRGAIPGECVEARIERVQRQVAWADTVRVLTASPDRVEVARGLTCGGQLLAHVSEARQRSLKGEMLADALRRIGKLVVAGPIDVLTGPADGYRTRARLHLRGGAVGFFDEGTHRLCDVAPARQLSVTSADVVQRLAAALAAAAPGLDAEIEWAEDAAGTTRVAHLAIARRQDLGAVAAIDPVGGLDGCGAALAGDPGAPRQQLWGDLRVVDRVRVGSTDASIAHDARAFFQGNRHLLQPLVEEVLAGVSGPVLDLYAGVGLFAVSAAIAGHRVTAVEGDAVAAADLADNAARAPGLTAVHAAVEAHLAGPRPDVGTVVVDPPRTGLSRDALAGVLAWRPDRLVYVSCDPATLARDLRGCQAAGYRIDGLRGVDLFPRTGHVEAVVRLVR